MAKNSSEDLKDAHNDGQSDAAKDEYHQPVPIDPITHFTNSKDDLDKWQELNEAYDKGWNNARK